MGIPEKLISEYDGKQQPVIIPIPDSREFHIPFEFRNDRKSFEAMRFLR